MSRTAGWIAPVVVNAGVVTGTWETDGGTLRVAWFREAGKPPAAKLKAETKRMAGITGRQLALEVATA